MKRKIVLDAGEHVCLFCGVTMTVAYDEYTPYYECHCDDAEKHRKIMSQIRELENTLPIPNYSLSQEYVLRKKS